jgi:hypothetical protein
LVAIVQLSFAVQMLMVGQLVSTHRSPSPQSPGFSLGVLQVFTPSNELHVGVLEAVLASVGFQQLAPRESPAATMSKIRLVMGTS